MNTPAPNHSPRSNPPVSVVIPLYNNAPWIRRALDSVLNQTYSNIEIIVVDDGSTDGGGDVVASYQDDRIRLIRQENAGSSAARNRGFEAAKYDLVALLDADDEWRPGFLDAVVTLSQTFDQAGVWSTAIDRVEPSGVIKNVRYRACPTNPGGGLVADFFRAVMGPSPACSSSALVKKQAFLDVGGYTVGQTRMQDLDFWARVACRYRFAFLPAPLAVYHKNIAGQATAAHPLYDEPGFFKTLETIIKEKRFDYTTESSVRNALSYYRLGVAANHIRARRFDTALEFIRRARGATAFRVNRIRWKLTLRARLHI